MKRSMRFLTTKQAKHVLARALACGALLTVPGCGIPNHRCAESGVTTPAAFPPSISNETSTENSSQITIEEFFNDPVLTELVHQGLGGNQELKILAEEIQIANNEVLARRGAYFPFVTFGGRAGLNKPSDFTIEGAALRSDEYRPGKLLPNPTPNFLLPVADLSWQVDIWRQLRNARDAAALRYLGTAEGRNYMVTRLVAEIAENYFKLMALDNRLMTLDKTIDLQQRSLEIAKANKEAARGTELGVARFLAEVRKNQSEKLIVQQEIIETENRINFLLGRFPQIVERVSTEFIDLNLRALSTGIPTQLLQNRPDIRKAERELSAAGLEVEVARARFYPALSISAGVGYEAFNPKYLFNTPEALAYNVAGNLVAPLINKAAIRADFCTANAKQLQSLYNYQRVVLNAFTEVVNRMSMVENYRQSIEIKRQQLTALESSVDVATKLFVNARTEYIDVLFAQRDLMEARLVLIETKNQQLSAVVNAYQALGGGCWVSIPSLESTVVPPKPPLPLPSAPAEEIPPAVPPPPDEKNKKQ